MSKSKSLEETVRNLLTEQIAKPQKLSIDIGGTKHDPSSPNKAHIEEDMPSTTLPIGTNRRRKKITAFSSTSLGKLENRGAAQRQGNQKLAGRYTSEEVTKKALKKVMEKKSEMALGKTATGQQGAVIDTKPQQLPVSGY